MVWISHDDVHVCLKKEGFNIAEFWFDHEFVEIYRCDPDNWLADLSPLDFFDY